MQGINNAHAGVSQLQAVDGGLSNISTILDRLQTLATESVSSTITSDQSTLNNEYMGLLSEITRQTTNIINLNTGDTFNNALTVFIGGGASDSGSTTVEIDLSCTDNAVDANSFGLASTNVLSGGVAFGSGSTQRLDGRGGSYLDLQFRGATAFNVEDESSSPSPISSIAHSTASNSSNCVLDGQTAAAASGFLPQAGRIEELLFQTGNSQVSSMLTWRLKQPDLSKSQVLTQTAVTGLAQAIQSLRPF